MESAAHLGVEIARIELVAKLASPDFILMPANSSFSSIRSLGEKGRLEAFAHHFGVVDGRSVVVERVLIKVFAILEVRVEECVPLVVALEVGPCPHRHSFEEPEDSRFGILFPTSTILNLLDV